MQATASSAPSKALATKKMSLLVALGLSTVFFCGIWKALSPTTLLGALPGVVCDRGGHWLFGVCNREKQ